MTLFTQTHGFGSLTRLAGLTLLTGTLIGCASIGKSLGSMRENAKIARTGEAEALPFVSKRERNGEQTATHLEKRRHNHIHPCGRALYHVWRRKTIKPARRESPVTPRGPVGLATEATVSRHAAASGA